PTSARPAPEPASTPSREEQGRRGHLARAGPLSFPRPPGCVDPPLSPRRCVPSQIAVVVVSIVSPPASVAPRVCSAKTQQTATPGDHSSGVPSLLHVPCGDWPTTSRPRLLEADAGGRPAATPSGPVRCAVAGEALPGANSDAGAVSGCEGAV